MSYIEEEHTHLAALALTAARAAKRRYPTSDLDDLRSEALMWCVTHPGKLRTYMEDDDKRRGQRMLTAAMRNAAKKYAREERAAQYGYDLEDEAFYSKRMLKGDGQKPGLLHFVFNKENWPKPPPSDGAGRGKGDPAEGNGWLTMMCDVHKAIESLSEDDRALVTEHFLFGQTYEQLGVLLGCSKATVAKRMDRAVGRVQEFLGGAKPREDPEEEGWEDQREPEYVGTRRVISNAHARYITANQ